MFEVKHRPVRVFWCAWCGGQESEERECKTCHKAKADLGWRVGDSYYSSMERIPKADR